MGRPPVTVHRRAVIQVGGAVGSAPAGPDRRRPGAEGVRLQLRGSEAAAPDRDDREPEGALRRLSDGGVTGTGVPWAAEGPG